MRRRIVRAVVRLDFGDPQPDAAMLDNHAEHLGRHLEDGAVVERPRQRSLATGAQTLLAHFS